MKQSRAPAPRIMIAEVGSVPGSIPHRLAAAAGALYWNKPAPALPAPTAQARTLGTDQPKTEPPRAPRQHRAPGQPLRPQYPPVSDRLYACCQEQLSLPPGVAVRSTRAAGHSLAGD